MAADCSERLMWDTDRGNIMQQLHEFRCRTSSMPPLHINAPRRNVKVPHHRSKKVLELLSKPRDPSASPSLLMIAPLSDERYRYLALKDHASTVPLMTSHPINAAQTSGLVKRRENEAPIWPNITKVDPNPVFPLSGFQTSASKSQLSTSGSRIQACGPHLSAPGYLHNISRLAAMAYTDCSKATEKIRLIFEQARSLTARNFYPNIDSGLLYRSPLDACGVPPNPSHQSANFSKTDQRSGSSYTSPTSQCACFACQLSKRTQPVQSDGAMNLMTSYAVVNEAKTSAKTDRRTTTGQSRSRLKRALSPSDAPVNQPPIKKLIAAKPPNLTSFAAPDAASSFGNSQDAPAPSRLVSNIFLHPSLQMPSSSSFRSCDFMMTPIFDHPPYLNPTPFRERPYVNSGTRLGFNDIFPTQVPNAIK